MATRASGRRGAPSRRLLRTPRRRRRPCGRRPCPARRRSGRTLLRHRPAPRACPRSQPGGYSADARDLRRREVMAGAVTPPGLAEPAPFALQVPLELIGAYAERFPGEADPAVLAAGAAARARGHYTREEFVALCRWKSPRSAPLVTQNSARDVEAAARTALAGDTPERERIEALLALRGVGWPTASVLLHVADPDGYPILDVRALQALGVARAPAYSFRFWAAYRAAWQDVRERAGVDGRTLDRALWQWSKEQGADPKEKAMENPHARAVRFDRYGGRDVLYVADVPMPAPATGEVVVEVRAAGINPGEAAIRTGALHERWPATFPSGQGSDLAGVVSVVGQGVTEFAPGDEVLGWSWARSSHATHAAVPVTQLVAKPPQLSWPVAGALYVVGV